MNVRSRILVILAAAIAIALVISFTVKIPSPQGEAATSIQKTADIKEFKVYKVGAKTNAGERMIQTLNVAAVESLPDKPDAKTVIFFDDSNDYIRTNWENLTFRKQMTDAIGNHAKLVSIGNDHTNFIRLIENAAGEKLGTPPQAGATFNGNDIKVEEVSAIGFTKRPLDAMCSTHNPDNPSQVAACPNLSSIFGPAEAYNEDGTVDTQTLNQLILRWMGDE